MAYQGIHCCLRVLFNLLHQRARLFYFNSHDLSAITKFTQAPTLECSTSATPLKQSQAMQGCQSDSPGPSSASEPSQCRVPPCFSRVTIHFGNCSLGRVPLSSSVCISRWDTGTRAGSHVLHSPGQREENSKSSLGGSDSRSYTLRGNNPESQG